MIMSNTKQTARHAEQERGFALTQITVNAGPFPVSFFTYHLCGSRRQISCPLRPCGCGAPPEKMPQKMFQKTLPTGNTPA